MHVEILSSSRARVATTCKLNLWLDVLGRREDGYHELASVFHELRFGDELALELEPASASSVRFTSDDAQLAREPKNLCARAAELWLAQRARGERWQVALHLAKRLPTGGGIGGGSGDAVAVLVGLEMLRRGASRREDLYAIALELGSDCPFFLWGGTALVRGRGERVEAIALPPLADPRARAVLVMPGLHVPTGAVFAQFAAQAGRSLPHPPLEDVLAARDLPSLRRALWNRLEDCSKVVEPRMVDVRRALERAWQVPPAMSGSGSTYFALAEDDARARELAEAARRALPSARIEIVPLAAEGVA